MYHFGGGIASGILAGIGQGLTDEEKKRQQATQQQTLQQGQYQSLHSQQYAGLNGQLLNNGRLFGKSQWQQYSQEMHRWAQEEIKRKRFDNELEEMLNEPTKKRDDIP